MTARVHPTDWEGRAHWHKGWLDAARHVHSPNVGPRPPHTPVELVVVHSISLPPGQYGGDAIERLFTNRLDWREHPYYATIQGAQVSAHFLIRRDGELVQFVSVDERAWHAGASSWDGRDNCNDYSLGIELEGLEGQTFEPAQYAALAALVRSAARHYPLRAIVGHEHIAPGRKSDPGCGFDWKTLIDTLNWPLPCYPPQVIAGLRDLQRG